MQQIPPEDLAGRTVEGEVFHEYDLDLIEGEVRGATFTDCTFQGVRFNAAVISECAFVNCRFVLCSFFDARFERCKLVGSRFERCTFGLLTVDGGNWSFVSLRGAELSRCTFSDVRLREADLGRADLREASLRNADLSAAVLDGADLRGADLRGSDLHAVDPTSTRLAGALVDVAQAITLATSLGVEVRAD